MGDGFKTLRVLNPQAVSEEGFGRPGAFLAVKATKRVDHKALRARSVTRACGLKACDERVSWLDI
ncbi:MAG: hypothetical protein ABI624_12540 [Casimicrobiaceae bacterium]